MTKVLPNHVHIQTQIGASQAIIRIARRDARLFNRIKDEGLQDEILAYLLSLRESTRAEVPLALQEGGVTEFDYLHDYLAICMAEAFDEPFRSYIPDLRRLGLADNPDDISDILHDKGFFGNRFMDDMTLMYVVNFLARIKHTPEECIWDISCFDSCDSGIVGLYDSLEDFVETAASPIIINTGHFRLAYEKGRIVPQLGPSSRCGFRYFPTLTFEVGTSLAGEVKMIGKEVMIAIMVDDWSFQRDYGVDMDQWSKDVQEWADSIKRNGLPGYHLRVLEQYDLTPADILHDRVLLPDRKRRKYVDHGPVILERRKRTRYERLHRDEFTQEDGAFLRAGCAHEFAQWIDDVRDFYPGFSLITFMPEVCSLDVERSAVDAFGRQHYRAVYGDTRNHVTLAEAIKTMTFESSNHQR